MMRRYIIYSILCASLCVGFCTKSFAQEDHNGLRSNLGFNMRYGFVDKDSNWVIEPRFDAVYEFSEGLALVQMEGKWGYYVDTTGATVIAPFYDRSTPFHEGFAIIRINGKYGYMDRTGKVVIEPRFEKATKFDNGMASVRIEGRYEYINTKGEILKFDENGYWIPETPEPKAEVRMLAEEEKQ